MAKAMLPAHAHAHVHPTCTSHRITLPKSQHRVQRQHLGPGVLPRTQETVDRPKCMASSSGLRHVGTGSSMWALTMHTLTAEGLMLLSCNSTARQLLPICLMLCQVDAQLTPGACKLLLRSSYRLRSTVQCLQHLPEAPSMHVHATMCLV